MIILQKPRRNPAAKYKPWFGRQMRRVHFDIHESPVAHSARNGLKTYVCEMTCARARQVAGVNEAIRKVFGDFRNGR